jgi:hypothetical protein
MVKMTRMTHGGHSAEEYFADDDATRVRVAGRDGQHH